MIYLFGLVVTPGKFGQCLTFCCMHFAQKSDDGRLTCRQSPFNKVQQSNFAKLLPLLHFLQYYAILLDKIRYDQSGIGHWVAITEKPIAASTLLSRMSLPHVPSFICDSYICSIIVDSRLIQLPTRVVSFK